MLNVATANAKHVAITSAFAAIGRTGDTAMPRSRKNTEAIAWEYHTSIILEREAAARRKHAQRAAIKAGIIFDHEAEPMEPGTNARIYVGDVVAIDLTVANPAEKLDATTLGVRLVSAACGCLEVERLFLACTAQTAAPASLRDQPRYCRLISDAAAAAASRGRACGA